MVQRWVLGPIIKPQAKKTTLIRDWVDGMGCILLHPFPVGSHASSSPCPGFCDFSSIAGHGPMALHPVKPSEKVTVRLRGHRVLKKSLCPHCKFSALMLSNRIARPPDFCLQRSVHRKEKPY
jgi:hypothetical protein